MEMITELLRPQREKPRVQPLLEEVRLLFENLYLTSSQIPERSKQAQEGEVESEESDGTGAQPILHILK